MLLNPDKIYRTVYRFDVLIPIRTGRTELLLGVNAETGDLIQISYGDPIEQPREVVPHGEVRRGEELPSAYAAYGSTELAAALRVVHADGGLSTELVYATHETVLEPRGTTLTTIRLRDRRYPFHVALHYRAWPAEDVIEAWVEFLHGEEGAVVLQEYPSVALTFRNAGRDCRLTTFHGLWEREHALQEETLGLGMKVLENRYGLWPSFGSNPSFMLGMDGPVGEEHGEVLAGALAWSGNWKMTFDCNFGRLSHDTRERRSLCVKAGINEAASDYHLDPGEAFRTPAFIMTWTREGKGQASRNFHRWARRQDAQPRPADGLVVLNSWEGAYFDFDEARLIAMMDGAASMGVELFVLDDGWFGNGADARDSSRAGLGDWQCNRTKLPRGLPFLAQEAKRRGLKFGIWVEPEMVNPQSECFRQHPDWVIQQSGREHVLYRSQLVLDLSNPVVQDYVFACVATLLRETPGIAYVKWDCNRPITNPGSPWLPRDRQSHLWVEYTRGLYRVLDRLNAEFPEVLFQACASGGGRIDYGILSRCGEFWTSDNTDALQRIFIQWGTSFVYPASMMAAHVTICPNHQTGRSVPLKCRLDVAMWGRLGLELDPRDMNQEELAMVRSAVADYKRLRPVFRSGDLYRLASPCDGPWAGLMVVGPERDHAVLFAYKTEHMLGVALPRLRLRGLDPQGTYLMRELNRGGGEPHTAHPEGALLSGAWLMQHGLEIRLDREFDTAVLELALDSRGRIQLDHGRSSEVL